MTGFVIPPGGPPGFRGPTIDDPDLLNAVLQTFRIREALQPFALSPVATPVIILGSVESIAPQEVVTPNLTDSVRIGLGTDSDALTIAAPAFGSADLVPDTQNNVAAATVLADSGQLTPPGTWYVDAHVSQNDGTTVDLALQWRNAANAANILEIPFFAGLRVGLIFRFSGVATNERFRLVTNTAIAGIVHSYVATRPAVPATAV